MAKYNLSFSFELIDKTGIAKVSGCNAFSFYNSGNVNVTIDNVQVLQPGESWPNFDPLPDIECKQNFKLNFNVGPDIPPPVFTTPVPGYNASVGSDYNAAGIFDTRIVLIKSHLTIA